MHYNTRNLKDLGKAVLRNAARRGFLRELARAALNFDDEQYRYRLPSRSIPDIAKNTEGVWINPSQEAFGEMPTADQLAIASIVKRIQPELIIEFGTFTGHSTLLMARNAPPSSRTVTIDLDTTDREDVAELRWEADINASMIGRIFRNQPEAERIEQCLIDSRKFDTTLYACRANIVLVDACHEYEFVLSDSRKAIQMLAAGGAILWHDYSYACPGVVQCLHELRESKGFDIHRLRGTSIAILYHSAEFAERG